MKSEFFHYFLSRLLTLIVFAMMVWVGSRLLMLFDNPEVGSLFVVAFFQNETANIIINFALLLVLYCLAEYFWFYVAKQKSQISFRKLKIFENQKIYNRFVVVAILLGIAITWFFILWNTVLLIYSLCLSGFFVSDIRNLYRHLKKWFEYVLMFMAGCYVILFANNINLYGIELIALCFGVCCFPMAKKALRRYKKSDLKSA